MSVTINTSAELLRSVVDRIERLDAEKQQIADARKAVIAEAVSNGFVKSGIDNVIKRRRMKPSEYQEAMALLDFYSHALGMEPDLPLFKAVSMMSVDITSRDSVIAALKGLVPENGAITVDAGGKKVLLRRNKNGTVTSEDVVEKPSVSQQQEKPSNPGWYPINDAPVPDCTNDEALEFGESDYHGNKPITKNPFPYGDQRRRFWDEGWRKASGTDGMGK